ncbi:MAG: transglutaminase domain-containing protein [Clostridiaceae bacterium]|jgi:transglutaminase-like putative cysteine protease|nr:transglutaminase domain-containing protein [Clostridiaceae bacterium]
MKSTKIIVLFLIMALLFSVASSVRADQTNTKTQQPGENFDTTKVDLGSVGARYIPIEEKRVKTRVQKIDLKYDYDLFGREDFEYFPLQLGNGDYKVLVFENITGNRYRQVKARSMKAEIKNPLDVYKASIQTVNWDPEMKIIKKASELTKGLKTDKQKITAIYNFVIDTFSYDYDKINNIEITYIPDIEKIYEEKSGICYDYSAVLAAMLRSQDIPAKLIKGYTDLVKGYHAWNEVYLAEEDRWLVIDSTYDSGLKKKNRKFTMEKDSKKYHGTKEY